MVRRPEVHLPNLSRLGIAIGNRGASAFPGSNAHEGTGIVALHDLFVLLLVEQGSSTASSGLTASKILPGALRHESRTLLD